MFIDQAHDLRHLAKQKKQYKKEKKNKKPQSVFSQRGPSTSVPLRCDLGQQVFDCRYRLIPYLLRLLHDVGVRLHFRGVPVTLQYIQGWNFA